MTLLSMTKLAKMAGVSTPAIHKSVKCGALEKTYVDGSKTGKIDSESQLTKQYLTKNTTMRRNSKHKASEPSVDKVTHEEISESRLNQSLLDMDRAEADRLKAIAQWESLEIKNAKARGELIEAKFAERILTKIQTVDVQEILPIAINFPSVAAGICGIEDQEKEMEMETELRKLIYLAFQHKKILIDEFIKEVHET